MGTHNRQRRREKAQRRAEQARRGPMRPPPGRAARDAATRVSRALWVLTGAVTGDVRAAMAEVESTALGDVAAIAEDLLTGLVNRAWADGWQPAELARHARRQDPPVGRLVAAAIAADLVGRDGDVLHPAWRAQAEAVAAAVTGTVDSPGDGWIARCLAAEGRRPTFGLLTIVRALRFGVEVGPLPVLIPPPGSDPATWDSRPDGASDDAVLSPLLAKVRALLAQAESTTFEAEAEAFTAKAQELMARHAIDAALVWSRAASRDRPVSVRVPVDDPYAEEKVRLLGIVAASSRCRAVHHERLGLVSVFGFRSDVAAAEVLFTSLLVQSQSAMRAEAASAPPGSHVRGARFRRGFLHGFASRIGQRLAAVNRTVEEETVSGGELGGAGPGPAAGSRRHASLLPVLAARLDAVDEAIAEDLGATTQRVAGRKYYDRLGWERGGLAADRAEINASVARRSAPPPPVPTPEAVGRLF